LIGSLGRKRVLDFGTEPFEAEPELAACGCSAWIPDSVGFDDEVAVAGCCC